MNGALATFIAGVVFAVGLAIAGMTDANRVLAFLNLRGDWDPSLALVMIAAIGVHAPLSRLARKRTRPFFSEKFHLPSLRSIDKRLVTGAALFGLGWGIAGYCPGPALVSLVWGNDKTLLFVGAMFFGMIAFALVDKVRSGASS